MLLTMEMKLLKIDEKAVKEVLDARVRAVMLKAVKAFIRAAVELIPVDTGMARGSFLHLGRILRVAVPNRPTGSRIVFVRGVPYQIDNSHAIYGYPPAKGRKKDKELGAELTTISGTPSPDITKETILTEKNYKYFFKLDARIFHLTLNDLLGSKGNPPWQAMDAGRHAFLNYLTANAVKGIPRLDEVLLTSKLSVGKSGIQKEAFKRSRVQKKVTNG